MKNNAINKLIKIVPTISLFAFVFIATTAQSFAALSIFNNTTANYVQGNCYYRAEDNPYFNQTTYNEVCNPRISIIETANSQQNSYYTSNYSFSQPTSQYYSTPSYSQPSYSSGYSYSQPVVYSYNYGGYDYGNSYGSNYNNGGYISDYNYGNTGYNNGYNSGYNGYYGDQNYTNYLDYPYYGAVQYYTPALGGYDSSPYYSGYNGDYTGYNNGYYNDNYYGGNSGTSNGCNYDNYGQYYCF